jgi:hypothetical protein
VYERNEIRCAKLMLNGGVMAPPYLIFIEIAGYAMGLIVG